MPFYSLHARLYLLIAFARASLDSTQTLKCHANVFASIATSGMPHALIQTTAATVANTLEQAYPGTFSPVMRSKLRKVGMSSSPILDLKEQQGLLDTPWHTDKTIDTHLSLSFGIDFEPYWFKYLARVFGTSESQVTDLIREVALNELNAPQGKGYTPDPRQSQWKNLGYSMKGTTYHSHGSYPSIDDYRFYYAYHSMMSVAMRLLRTMPVVRDPRWEESRNRWQEWLNGHFLTRQDGKWLVDRRDPTPLKRRSWTRKESDENWLWQLKTDDFIDVLTCYNPIGFPICVRGRWSDLRDDHIENVQITSAWANPDSAAALATFLRRSDPGNFGLPDYEESDLEVNGVPNDMTGWLFVEGIGEKGLDRFDPHARDILYPPPQIGASFAMASRLSSDGEKRIWTDRSAKMCLVSECWSDEDISEKDKP